MHDAMADWYKVTLSRDNPKVNNKASDLQNAFESAFTATGAPQDATLFSGYSEDRKNQLYYFSPGAARIAKNLRR